MNNGDPLHRANRAAIAAAAIALACGAFAGTESLVSNSPFLPQSAVTPAASNGVLDNFELRGVASFGGVATFSIYDTTNNRGYWIPLSGTEAGVRVASYDAATEAVVVEGSGGSRRLFLKEAQIQTMMPPAPVNVATVPPQGSPLPAAAGAVTTEQEMAERRQRIIEELRRRRALRQQTQGQPAPQ
ncbi:MAG TPA: hypothetical protein VMM36_07750 [Opitutaceae bacterium]|nr:hypothetical protein [Opitutaceae bacterium]